MLRYESRRATTCGTSAHRDTTDKLSCGARLAGRRRRARERARGMSEGAKRPSESAGEGVANWCPGAVESSRSQHYRARTRANRPGRVWPIGVRVSRRRLDHTTTTHIQNRPGREWLKEVSGCRTVVSVALTPLYTYWGGGGCKECPCVVQSCDSCVRDRRGIHTSPRCTLAAVSR